MSKKCTTNPCKDSVILKNNIFDSPFTKCTGNRINSVGPKLFIHKPEKMNSDIPMTNVSTTSRPLPGF